MRRHLFSAALTLLAASSIAMSAAPATADEPTFAAGSRVEGRFGSQWDRCTVIGDRRATGGYLLQCDGKPDQQTVFAASDVRSMQGADRPAIRKSLAPAHVRAPVAAAAPDNGKGMPPAVGVYGCMNQDGYEMPGLQFGLLDARTYSTYEGRRGRYVYSAQTGILTFSTGPYVGLREVRETQRSFRMLDEHGARTAFMCPLEPKNPRKNHW
jgi:hypothetical protein